MPNVLKNTIVFAGLVPGVPTALAHGLVDVEGQGLIPDHAETDNGDVVIVSADATNVTVRNDGGAAASANILAEHWHSTPRALPPGSTALSPQPFIPVGSSSSAAGIASNVFVPDAGVVTRTIYVRLAGSDANGDGTLANPYRTIVRAFQDIPTFIRGTNWIIDCTGIGIEQLASTLVLQSFISSDDSVVNPARDQTNALFQLGSITLQADPTIFDTLTPAQITGTTADALTGQLTINTTRAFGANTLRDKFIVDSLGFAYPIVSNTAGPNSDIELPAITIIGGVAATLNIVDPSAQLQGPVGGGAALVVRNSQVNITINGVNLDANAGVSALEYRNNASDNAGLLFGTAIIRGVLLNSPGSISGTPLFFGAALLDEDLNTNGSGLGLTSCSCRAIDFFNLRAFWRNPWTGVTIDTCGPVVGSTGVDGVNIFAMELNNVTIRNGTVAGVFVGPGAVAKLDNVQIHNCVGNGVTVDGCQRLLLRDVRNTAGGANGGIGVVITNGGNVETQGTVDVSGVGGDYKVGGNATTAAGGVGWAAFTGDENDLAAITPQLCRMF